MEISRLLNTIQTRAVDMIPYEYAGLQNIKHLSPDAGNACNFQTLVIIQPKPTSDPGDTRLFIDLNASSDSAGFYTYPITMECALTSTGLDVTANFDSSIIDTKQMQRVLNQFTHILHQMSAHKTDMRLGDIELVSPEDISDIRGWNTGNLTTEVLDSCVHDLVERHVKIQPNSPAVYAWDGNLTYSQLNELSSLLSYKLIALGVGPEIFIPLCFTKSKFSIVAMLAVLKAGGAFVSIDPSYPVDRISSILDAPNSKIVLAAPAYAPIF